MVAALSDAGCAIIVLDGVITVRDADFGGRNRQRDTNVTVVSAAADGGPAGGTALNRAALEASPRLVHHVHLGATAVFRGISVTGNAKPDDPDPMFSVLQLLPGSAVVLQQSDVRLPNDACIAGGDEVGRAAGRVAWR